MLCINLLYFYQNQTINHLSNFTHVVDVDECLSGISDCQHICINTVGGFNCECEFGYALHDIDRKTCEKGIGLNQIIVLH